MSNFVKLLTCSTIAIFTLLLIAGISNRYLRESYTNIKEMNDSDESISCTRGCSPAKKIYGNCNSKVEKDNQGRCYKTCPYECPNSESYSSCRYDSECSGCGVTRFRVNCDGSLNPEWGDDTTLDNPVINNTKQPQRLQKYTGFGPSDEMAKTADFQNNKDGLDTKDIDPDKINVSEHINSMPYIDPQDPIENSTTDIKPECCGDIHYHYYMMNPNPSGSTLDDISRAGGIISNKLQDGVHNAVRRQKQIRDSSKYNSAYNYGVPGSEFPTDAEGALQQFTVKYKERPSVTGMFEVNGPLGANIGMYGNHLQGCNCPPADAESPGN